MAKERGKKNSNSSQKAESAGGNILQVNGNIIFNEPVKNPPKPQKRLSIKKAVTIFCFVVLILVTTYSKVQKILGFKTLISSNQNDSIVKKPNVLITGVIKDRKSKKGIPNAYITSDIKLKDTVVTTSDGTFQFEASGDVGQSIRLYVQATGYQPRNEYRSFGLPIEIELDKR